MAEKEAAACLLLAVLLDDDDEDENKGRGRTRNWIKRRQTEGMYANLVQELLVEDTKSYKEMLRMDHTCFKKILEYIEPYISPSESFHGTRVIKAPERLVLTIRFLATGESFRSLSFQFRISERAISYIIEEVTKAIVCYVGKDYIKLPASPQEWLDISQMFSTRWNFPNCVGAIDGKHIII